MSPKKDPNDLLKLENDFYVKPRVNGKRKGASYERQLAKKLNDRFNTKDFSRTPGSGAFATTHNLPEHLKIHGDLITPENFKFVIEAKRGYDITLEDLWKPKSNFYKFISQAKRDGKESDKPWLLIYKKDRQKDMVVCEHKFDIQERALVKVKYNIYLLEDILKLDDLSFLNVS
jgi:Holliday junction resolvase